MAAPTCLRRCFAPPSLGGDADRHAPALTSSARFPLRGAATDARLPPPPISRAPLPSGGRGPTLPRRWPRPRARASVPGARPWAVSALGARRVRVRSRGRARSGESDCGYPVRGPRAGGGLEEGASVGRGRSLHQGGGPGKRREPAGARRGLS